MKIEGERDGFKNVLEDFKMSLQRDEGGLDLVELFRYLSAVCRKAEKPIVLMIDEADSAANNQVFIDRKSVV